MTRLTTSYIIPTFNRSHLLKRNLLRINYSDQLKYLDEIIVVDDGSQDNTKEVCEEFKKTYPNLRYLYHDNPNWDSCSIPKNIGLKNAIGDIVIYAEPEIVMITDCIKQFQDKIKHDPTKFYNAGKVFCLPFNMAMTFDDLKDINKYLSDKPMIVHEPGMSEYGNSITILIKWVALFMFAGLKKELMAVNGWDESQSRANGGGGWGWDDTDFVTRLRVNKYHESIEEDINIIHQYHNPSPYRDDWRKNEKIMMDKYEINEDGSKGEMKKEFIMANKSRNWGVL